jgi:hypothetical protein
MYRSVLLLVCFEYLTVQLVASIFSGHHGYVTWDPML